MGANLATVTLSVQRFTPRAQRERERNRSASPFAKKGSPFGSSRAPRRARGKSWKQEYTVTLPADSTVLDALLHIKRVEDPSLAFRYSCGHGMCGSDAVAINGSPTLLCTAKLRDVAQPSRTDNDGFRPTGSVERVKEPESDGSDPARSEDGSQPVDLGVINVGPLPGFPVLRDLIVDIDPMLDQIRRMKPYLIADGVLATTHDGKVDVFEYLQRPEQLARYEVLTNCIACGVCEGSCPVYAGGEAFVGPAALIAQSRFVNDSRDEATEERLEMIDTADGVQACQSVRACSRPCPKGIDVGEEVWQLIAQVKER
ncbi:succinate dehydrogenase/fumarate reductase iron-sulfur subunit [Bifidobacterium magnum]|uniref:succinate dehydrogenase n=1 Tax=Bifidobacterium magnum TaxID=1692 RepID=A0A087BCC8_9BIFI|nr:2Fe-2S iron-sulfur cluster-binding protein [Bifidobacterium magnum]KFI68678.1 Succinate dehydrogenase, iron-sulfur protein [Bifidobacterium magnum]